MPETFGQYKVLEEIGAGRFGHVYRARDTRVGRTVAVKTISAGLADTPDARERLLQEAQRVVALSQPNLAALYEAGEAEGQLYLACEFVEGQTLKALVGGRPLNPRRAVDLACQIADGLAEAHAADLTHGGLDLDAIVVTPKGRAKILDLGLAAWARGGSSVSTATPVEDVADLGQLLFAMLTGGPPAPGGDVSRVIVRAIPTELDPIVSKALGEGGGYGSAAALAGDLRMVSALLEERKEASDAIAGPPMPARASRGRMPLVLLGAAILIVAALAWWYFRPA